MIDSGEMQVVYTSTDDMVADILTKPLQGKQFLKLRAILLSSIPPKQMEKKQA